MSEGSGLLGESVNGVIGPVWETVWDVLKKQYREGLDKTQLEEKRLAVEQARTAAAAAYHQNYVDRHCNIKVLPGLMKEAMPLDNIYTAVKFLSNSELKYFSLDRLEELYRSANQRFLRVGDNERQDGLEVANQQKYLMVLGGPGVGKSTFLRKLGLEALKGNLEHDLMPVFIELKQFKSRKKTILQAIAEELEISGFPGPEVLANSLLKNGKMLILLDGLDEVPAEYTDDALEQIRNFCDRHSGLQFFSRRGQNRFVVSCRIASYKGGLNRFIDVTMAEFDDEQIEQFIHRWFTSTEDKAADTASTFWGLLQENENAAAKELAQTPLLLTFLCLVYDRSQSLPTVRSTLYRDALDILLKDWAAEKRIKQKPIYKGFHVDLEKVLLSEIAYKSFVADQLFFSKQELTDQIASFLSDTIDAPPYLDGSEVLEAIAVQQGILVERATNTYSFSHLTLQEFLAARHISQERLVSELVENYSTDERWREVFLLVSGLLENQSYSLWLLMEKQANKYINTPRLYDLLSTSANLVNQSEQSYKILAQRAWWLNSQLTIAIASDTASDIEKAIERAIDRGRDIDRDRDRARAIARAIASDIARDIDIDTAIDRAIDSYIYSYSDIDTAIDRASYIDRAIDRASYIAINRDNDIARDSDIAIARNRARNIAIAIARNSARNIDIGSARNKNIASKSNSARAIAIAIASNIVTAIASNIIRASAIDSITDYSALANRLDNLNHQIPLADAKAKIWFAFLTQLIDAYCQAFYIDKELIKLSPDEAESIANYLYITKLIIDCKNSAVRVSKKQWAAIESRLLTPTSEAD